MLGSEPEATHKCEYRRIVIVELLGSSDCFTQSPSLIEHGVGLCPLVIFCTGPVSVLNLAQNRQIHFIIVTPQQRTFVRRYMYLLCVLQSYGG